MGTLVHLPTGLRLPLRAVHVVGRAPACDLHIGASEVSAQHAALRWNGDRWTVRDLGSRNGTFVDGHRLELGQEAPLARDAGIAFGRASVVFRLVDDDPPTALAIPLEGGTPVSVEQGLLFLPDPEHPSVTIHQAADGDWVSDTSGAVLRDGQVFEAAGRHWRLHLPGVVQVTATGPASSMRLARLSIRFVVSRDREHVGLVLLDEHGELDLGARAHHHFLLVLAEQRLADKARGDLPNQEHGWLEPEELGRKVRLEPQALYVHTCRVRKHLANAGVLDAFDIIERRQNGKWRIGVGRLEVSHS